MVAFVVSSTIERVHLPSSSVRSSGIVQTKDPVFAMETGGNVSGEIEEGDGWNYSYQQLVSPLNL